MLRLLGAVAFSFVSTLTHSFEVTPYIVNGSTANITQFPSFASLFFRSDRLYSVNSFCGATMINEQYALTAAHCIYGQESTMLNTVVVPQLEDEEQFLNAPQARVEAFYYPDTYTNSSGDLWRDDIAILKLETPLSIGNLRPLLNTQYNNVYPNSNEFVALGHGYIEGNMLGGTQLLETDLNLISVAQCREEIGSAVTSKQLCFGGAEDEGYQNSTCSGDSGGPVYFYNGIEYIQVGITSFGPIVCGDVRYNVTSVFTDIYDYQGWIDDVLSGKETPKAYINYEGGLRKLVSNHDSGSQAESVSESMSSKSAGVFSYKILVSLLALILYRRNKFRNDIKSK